MSLLNAALAFGAFAFSIPLIIHLFFRSRFKTVDWGAMYLLESVIRVNRRRMQVTNLLLLLLRCLIPVLLAFCLARPVWTGLRALAGDAPKTLVIAIDDSRSMSATPPGEPSRIEFAKQELRKVLDGLTRRDEVILVRSSRIAAIPAKMGASDALAALRKLDAKGSAVSIGQLMDAAVTAAQEGSHSRKQILLVSDFQANSIDGSTLDLARRVATTLQLTSPSGGDGRIVIDMLDVAQQWTDLANVSVDAVAIDSPVVVSERAGVYSATLRNASDLPANELRLVWSIDGKPLEPRVVSIDANSTATNRLTHTIDQPGMHEVAVTIDRGDVLIDDNRRSVAVEVMDEVNVILVDGQPSEVPLKGQADFLAIALSPFAFGGDDQPDPVRAAVVTPQKLVRSLDENDVRVIILCGVDRLADEATAQITNFVNAGGALVVFDGPNLRPELYNQAWRATQASLSFPATLGEIIGTPEVGPGAADQTFSVEKPAALYQPWRILATGDENPLSDVSLSAYRKLTVVKSAVAESNDAFVAVRSTDGAPLVVIGSAGQGTVVQFAFTGNDGWTDLPLRPVFLPLIQQLVLDLAGKRNEAMIEVGQPIVIPDQEWGESEPKNPPRTQTRFTARTPRGDIEIESPTGGEPVRLTATHDAGVYTIQKRITNLDEADQSVTRQAMRIAAVSPAESMLVDVTQDRQDTLAGILGTKVFDSAAVLQQADRSRSFGREIWRFLLVLLLIALVVELWLQQNLVARRKSASVAS